MFFKHITRFQAQLLLLLASILPLALAYISQYGFGLEPCILCLYQRVPYALMAAIIGLLLIIRRPLTHIGWFLLLVLIVSEILIAAYHVGVEQGIITEGVGCIEAVAADSVAALRAQLLSAPTVACNQPAFIFLGLSMAAWNVVYATILAISMLLFRRSFMVK